MKQSTHSLLKKTIIQSAQDVLAIRAKSSSIINFTDCDFKLPVNLYEIIKDNPTEGIEIILSDNPDQEPDLITPHLNAGLYISNLRFTKGVYLRDSIFNGPVDFENVVFEKGLEFARNVLNQRAEFNGVEFRDRSAFQVMKVKGNVSFMKCSVSQGQLGFKNAEIEGDFVCFDSHFVSGLDLSRSKIDRKIVLSQTRIDGLLNISMSTIGGLQLLGNNQNKERATLNEVDLRDAKIKEQIQIHLMNVTGKFNADSAVFNSAVFIDHSVFKDKNYLTNITFENVLTISECCFEKHLSLAYSRLNQHATIRKSTFEHADVSFTGVQFNAAFWIGGQLETDYKVKFDGSMSFQGAIVSPNSIVRILGINSNLYPQGSLKFKDALIKGLVDIRDVHLAHIDFSGTVVPGNVQDNHTLIRAIKDKDTARLLKNEAKKINNSISAIAYYKAEVAHHAKTLSFKQLGDAIILRLNSWSNNYGLNWLQGVAFTIISGLICFTSFIISVNGISIVYDSSSSFLFFREQFWAGFLNYFWLPTGFETLVGTNSTHVAGGLLGAIFFILGKVLIAYGIYQTIAAFRKYL
ncbi:MAG: hypothetical protein V4577_07390 [Bacteroidota bacterium]